MLKSEYFALNLGKFADNISNAYFAILNVSLISLLYTAYVNQKSQIYLGFWLLHVANNGYDTDIP